VTQVVTSITPRELRSCDAGQVSLNSVRVWVAVRGCGVSSKSKKAYIYTLHCNPTADLPKWVQKKTIVIHN